MGAPNLGVNIDIGHSIVGGEPPAESLMLVAKGGLPFYVHINDNNGKWDWDLVAGSCNVWEYLEFLFYLKEFGYDGWITSDAVRGETWSEPKVPKPIAGMLAPE